jgi:hypothetical protein
MGLSTGGATLPGVAPPNGARTESLEKGSEPMSVWWIRSPSGTALARGVAATAARAWEAAAASAARLADDGGDHVVLYVHVDRQVAQLYPAHGSQPASATTRQVAADLAAALVHL